MKNARKVIAMVVQNLLSTLTQFHLTFQKQLMIVIHQANLK